MKQNGDDGWIFHHRIQSKKNMRNNKKKQVNEYMGVVMVIIIITNTATTIFVGMLATNEWKWRKSNLLCEVLWTLKQFYYMSSNAYSQWRNDQKKCTNRDKYMTAIDLPIGYLFFTGLLSQTTTIYEKICAMLSIMWLEFLWENIRWSFMVKLVVLNVKKMSKTSKRTLYTTSKLKSMVKENAKWEEFLVEKISTKFFFYHRHD